MKAKKSLIDRRWWWILFTIGILYFFLSFGPAGHLMEHLFSTHADLNIAKFEITLVCGIFLCGFLFLRKKKDPSPSN